MSREKLATAQLQRLNMFKRHHRPAAVTIGPSMVQFFKQSIEKRHTKLSKIAECWGMLVPQALNDHCSLESLTRGNLTVIVDSSPHLYELKQLLLAGLQQQILLACKSCGLTKITLKPGRWYDDGDGSGGDRKLTFK